MPTVLGMARYKADARGCWPEVPGKPDYFNHGKGMGSDTNLQDDT